MPSVYSYPPPGPRQQQAIDESDDDSAVVIEQVNPGSASMTHRTNRNLMPVAFIPPLNAAEMALPHKQTTVINPKDMHEIERNFPGQNSSSGKKRKKKSKPGESENDVASKKQARRQITAILDTASATEQSRNALHNMYTKAQPSHGYPRDIRKYEHGENHRAREPSPSSGQHQHAAQTQTQQKFMGQMLQQKRAKSALEASMKSRQLDHRVQNEHGRISRETENRYAQSPREATDQHARPRHTARDEERSGVTGARQYYARDRPVQYVDYSATRGQEQQQQQQQTPSTRQHRTQRQQHSRQQQQQESQLRQHRQHSAYSTAPSGQTGALRSHSGNSQAPTAAARTVYRTAARTNATRMESATAAAAAAPGMDAASPATTVAAGATTAPITIIQGADGTYYQVSTVQTAGLQYATGGNATNYVYATEQGNHVVLNPQVAQLANAAPDAATATKKSSRRTHKAQSQSRSTTDGDHNVVELLHDSDDDFDGDAVDDGVKVPDGFKRMKTGKNCQAVLQTLINNGAFRLEIRNGVYIMSSS
eukprot:CAMPEP_0119564348 /NCGR_PEP_ID=MMETSP1352-20130426/26721_1 /TAXON_ID=265584 /ORGANISM="Stauroneis constricta, Strain CCMP1120" /LENGTH=537 /DNA_ID=CAMNT_0007613101 /DNA_START=91 /DNA_END=1700 /DNA_ORIENTATION=+